MNTLLQITGETKVDAGFKGERKISSDELLFSGRVFFYSESSIPQPEWDAMLSELASSGISPRIRAAIVAEERSKWEMPLAFICHDSNDKDDVARPLALQLIKTIGPIWYDEFSLKVGQSLRESIEKGLKECSHCILILSPAFLSNKGWTKVEFNSIFTREILETANLVLPVWHGVTAREIYEYSPSLADRVGVQWSLGVEAVARKLQTSIVY